MEVLLNTVRNGSLRVYVVFEKDVVSHSNNKITSAAAFIMHLKARNVMHQGSVIILLQIG